MVRNNELPPLFISETIAMYITFKTSPPSRQTVFVIRGTFNLRPYRVHEPCPPPHKTHRQRLSSCMHQKTARRLRWI